MTNIKLIIEYDGYNYQGWQRQAKDKGCGVQQVVEEALSELLRQKITINGAGRTDSGVHALGQVANFKAPKPLPAANFKPALNNILPPDIRIKQSLAVGADFHARYSAIGKRYQYLLAYDQVTAFNQRYFWPQAKALDIAAMEEAATYLIGEHDFRHFSLKGGKIVDFRRNIEHIKIFKPNPAIIPCYLSDPLLIEAKGNGFLYKMVRLIAARLVAVGQGKIKPQQMADFLAGQVPLRIPPAPANGLSLVEVYY